MDRLEYSRRQGGNGFIEHQIPSAAISLKIFSNDGGKSTPLGTEKLKPCAWPGP